MGYRFTEFVLDEDEEEYTIQDMFKAKNIGTNQDTGVWILLTLLFLVCLCCGGLFFSYYLFKHCNRTRHVEYLSNVSRIDSQRLPSSYVERRRTTLSRVDSRRLPSNNFGRTRTSRSLSRSISRRSFRNPPDESRI